MRRISIDVTEAARAWLAETGYDPAYGARPLRRLIQSAIGDRLARMLIGGEVTDGGKVTVDVLDGELPSRPSERRRVRRGSAAPPIVAETAGRGWDAPDRR